MKQIYSAGIVTYVLRDNKPIYLLLHYQAGHWEFPKGTMEPGETKQETAMRELTEETGLIAILDDAFEESIQYIYTDYQGEKGLKTVTFFVGEATNTDVQLSHEHIDFAWLPYDQALDKITYERGREILKKAHLYICSYLRKNV